MDRNYVASSNIASIGYDEPHETLEIEFLNGAVYQYYNVPPGIYQSLMQEGSKGGFFNTYIKNNFPFTRV